MVPMEYWRLAWRGKYTLFRENYSRRGKQFSMMHPHLSCQSLPLPASAAGGRLQFPPNISFRLFKLNSYTESEHTPRFFLPRPWTSQWVQHDWLHGQYKKDRPSVYPPSVKKMKIGKVEWFYHRLIRFQKHILVLYTMPLQSPSHWRLS